MLLQRRRTRTYKGEAHDHLIDLLADVNAFVTGFSLLPQVYQACTSHNLAGLSLMTFLITGCAQVIWQIYGWHRRAYPIIISSALLGICSFTIVFLILHS